MDADLDVRRGEFSLRARLRAGPGEVLAVVGPNGAGKSTALRALAGLVPLRAGRIEVGGQVWDAPADGVLAAPAERRAGVVFQDHRLFPHLSVLDNVAFSRRSRGHRRRAARRHADEVLERLGIAALRGRRPRELSGGQAQRVALARALAADPALLLLDEPLAALDAGARRQVRGELQRWLRAFDGPSVLVTHDPLEAVVLADHVVVLEDGRVVQDGTPAEVAARPATAYVADLVGVALWSGRVVGAGRVALDDGPLLPCRTGGLAVGDRALVAARPADLDVHPVGAGGDPTEPVDPARTAWPGTVTAVEPRTEVVRVDVDGAPRAAVDLAPARAAALGLAPGHRVLVSADPARLHAYAPSAGR
ncbi:ABC transporter ATP-binding protein [Kineococcus sp. SYSU DK004]|uniref:ABC transporter ATP-binding protein n=1 Tax=Kineococcus sp. SYSU DK004 TaxID=3383125 RepID=UPI003D7EA93D